ncbi:hypothetical protein GW17_00022967 [Ensete ventricosum]|nr:hypothetical protein GW17_00022967 [Ensete ventricosum]
MDFFELAKIIFSRVQKLEPENVVKIMGCIFLKEPSEQEMMQLAFGPDTMLLSKISDAKNMLGMFSPKNSMSDMQIGSYPPSGSHPFSSPFNFHIPAPYWDPQLSSEPQCPSHNFDFVPRPYNTGSNGDKYSFQSQSQPMEQLDAMSHINNYYYHPEAAALGGGMASRTGRRSHSLSDLPIKACHYFNKGYCRHGMNCRYSHAQSFPDGYSHAFSSNLTDYANEEHVYTPKSLENLEMEITGLLRSRRGVPVSIASLPMLYFEKYGKNLQAEGYLTESQRHGKSGFNLTKLLSHLRKSIRLIERYCQQYGQVRDVRIPCQDKRMFGFVSFVHPETVNMILMKRNPHYICGARVYALDTLNNGCTNDDKARQIVNSFNDQESGHLELPESPFASPPVGSSISAVI